MRKKKEYIFVIFHRCKSTKNKWDILTGTWYSKKEAAEAINIAITWVSEFQRPGDKPVEFKIVKVEVPIPKD